MIHAKASGWIHRAVVIGILSGVFPWCSSSSVVLAQGRLQAARDDVRYDDPTPAPSPEPEKKKEPERELKPSRKSNLAVSISNTDPCHRDEEECETFGEMIGSALGQGLLTVGAYAVASPF